MLQLRLRFAVVLLFAAAMPAMGAGAVASTSLYVVRHDRWSRDDEHDYSAFIQAIGDSDCGSLDACLRSPANPFNGTDAPDYRFESDCADLPYVLRFYFAWKRGLPFSYVSAVTTADSTSEDIRYSHAGNKVAARSDVPGGVSSGYRIIERIRAEVSSATYRIHPDARRALYADFYSPAIDPKSIKPGTVVYDPAGHVAIVYRVDPDGRVHCFDAHVDYTLTQMVFDVRFARMRPADGAGFKNWRPITLVGAKTMQDGSLRGGHIRPAANAELGDFSLEQYYGTGARPADEAWASGGFTAGGERLDFYDFVRARLGGGKLVFDPLKEVHDTTWSICSDLYYRSLTVELARRNGIAQAPHPGRLPGNIYGTDGDWETYSTPSRDARLKTVFKALRDAVERFVEMDARKDTAHLSYAGDNLAADMLKAYSQVERYCVVDYRRSDGSVARLSYEAARKRLFAMSFDPYHCPELRWGATDAAELSTCPDDAIKQSWYAAEQNLRNQIERTYDARMDFNLAELQAPGPGKGVGSPPDTDVRSYLESVMKRSGGEVQPEPARLP